MEHNGSFNMCFFYSRKTGTNTKCNISQHEQYLGRVAEVLFMLVFRFLKLTENAVVVLYNHGL